jgi:hypothetical protein
MPLFLQALPLSIRTLPHYLVVLPFLAALSLGFGVLTILPLVGLVVPGTIAALWTIVGLRCALAARGHGNEPDFGALIGSSLTFCLINFVFSLVVGAMTMAVLFLVGLLSSPETGVASAPAVQRYSDLAAFATVGLLVALYGSAMAVPMTAAAVASTPNGRKPDAFYGFGTGLVSLTVVLVAWIALGGVLSLFGEVALVMGILLEGLFALVSEDEMPDFGFVDTKFVLSLLAMVWASSWYFATAVLAWERATETRRQARQPAPVGPRVSADELRALREARMQRGADDGSAGI